MCVCMCLYIFVDVYMVMEKNVWAHIPEQMTLVT